MLALLIIVLIVLFFVVIPFILGAFDHGSEWLMRPSMYINLWLLRMSSAGYSFKLFLLKLFR